MTVLVAALLLSASISIGLRTTPLFVSERVHPIARLVTAAIVGTLVTTVVLEVCSSYRVFDLGLGLLLSLSLVGPFDVAKWWFRWRRRSTR